MAENELDNRPAEASPPPSNPDVAAIVEAEIKASDDKGKAAEAPAQSKEAQPKPEEKFFLKNWKTPEEAQKGVTELERKMHEQAAELKALKEGKAPAADPGQGQPQPTGTTAAPEGDDAAELTNEELSDLAKEDPALFLEYTTKKTVNAVVAEVKKFLDPILNTQLKPLTEAHSRMQAEQTRQQQETYHAETKKEFGEDFDRYMTAVADPAAVSDLAKKSPVVAQTIGTLYKAGREAEAIRLFMQEMQRIELLGAKAGRQRSTKADAEPGTRIPAKKPNPNATTEDMVDEAIREASA